MALDAATREALQARVRFYRDLGLTEFYRRPVDLALLTAVQELPLTSVQDLGAPGPDSGTWDSASQPDNLFPSTTQEEPIPPRKPFPNAPAIGAAVAPAQRAEALQIIRDEIGDCTRCALHSGRNKLVFGDGDPNARLLFVGSTGADIEKAFANVAYLFKDGKICVEEGKVVDMGNKHTFWVDAKVKENKQVMHDIREKPLKYYSLNENNYPVPESYAPHQHILTVDAVQ